MVFEYRLRWIDQIDGEFYEKASIISFGSESCSMALPDIGGYERTVKIIAKLNKQPKLVTPRISQKELDKVVVLLDYIVAEKMPLDIVVNDWGILYYCLRHQETFRIHLGRQLCRSLLDSPWAGQIIRKEKPEIMELMKGHPYDDTAKMALLQKWRIQGIEINKMKGMEKSILQLLNSGWKVAINLQNYLLTVGQVCLAKRLYPHLECKELCMKEFQIEPLKKWLTFMKNQEDFTAQEKDIMKGMKITGNSVLKEQLIEIAQYADFNNIQAIVMDPK